MKLSYKINLLLLLVFILFAGIGFITNEQYKRINNRKAAIQTTKYQLSSSKEVAAEIISNIMLNQDIALSLLLKRIKVRDKLTAISLISMEEFEREIVGYKCIESYKRDAACVIKLGPNYTLYYKLEYGNSDFGVLKKTYKINNASLFSANEILKFSLILITLYVIALAMLSFALKRIVVNPLRNICSHIQPLRRGQFNINIPKQKTIELGYLADNICKISQELKSYQKEVARNANLAAIGQTASQIAHDIRKPLTGLKALLTVLSEKKDDEVFIRSMVKNVEGTINRTNAMLSEILEFSKDETSLECKKSNPQSMITASLSDALTAMDDLDVSIEYDLRHRNYLNVDSDRIIRVLTNIIGNAIEAMEGKGNLWVRTKDISSQPPRLDIPGPSTQTAGVRMKVTIGNDGPVIPENVQKKLFDPFFTKGKKGGTGLGLSICQKIVEMHGGSIKVSSRPSTSSGRTSKTEFVIELPASEGRLFVNEAELIRHSDELKTFREEDAVREEYGDSANTAEFMRLHKERGRPSYLLIVDDEPLFRETVRSLLRTIPQVRDHVKVVESSSAEEALNLFTARDFNYVIADIDLGKNRMNGYEFAGIILDKYPNTNVVIHSNKRREEMDKNIREIALSSRDKVETPRNDRNRFMGFLPKPMKQSELLQFLACKTFESFKVGKVPDAQAKKVLIVNDDDALLLTFRILLKSPDVKVLEAMNMNTALKHLTDNKVDIILSDINLGEDEPDGYELLKKVREKDKSLPFYLISGYSRQDEEPKAKELGANGYLQLPVEQAQLKELLQ